MATSLKKPTLATHSTDLDLRREYVMNLQLIKMKQRKETWKYAAVLMLVCALLGFTL